MRSGRKTPLTLIETQFRLGDWIDQHMTVESKSGPEWVCACPVCGRPKLAIHVARKVFQCLSAACQFRAWSPRYLVSAVLAISSDRADEVMASYGIGREIGPVSPLIEPRTVRPPHKMPIASLPPVAWNWLGLAQQAYLERRQIPREHWALMGLSTILGDHTRSKADRNLPGRILFPIWNQAGKVVFWLARSITKTAKAKVINMPRPCREEAHSEWCTCYHEAWGLPPVPQAAEAHEVVIGLHLIERGKPVIVVEGPTDVARCGPGFVGTLGAHLSIEQAALIAAAGPSEAIILFDGDEGGRKAAPKAAETLSAYLPTRWLVCPPDQDPGIMGRDLAIAYVHENQQAIPRLSTKVFSSHKPRLQAPFLRKLEKT